MKTVSACIAIQSHTCLKQTKQKEPSKNEEWPFTADFSDCRMDNQNIKTDYKILFCSKKNETDKMVLL